MVPGSYDRTLHTLGPTESYNSNHDMYTEHRRHSGALGGERKGQARRADIKRGPLAASTAASNVVRELLSRAAELARHRLVRDPARGNRVKGTPSSRRAKFDFDAAPDHLGSTSSREPCG